MSSPRWRLCFLLSMMSLALLLAGCQLYLLDRDRDDDDDNGGGGSGDSTLTLRIVGSQGALLNDVVLAVFRVELSRASGGVSGFDLDPRDVSLFSTADGELLVNNVTVPSGNYSRVRIFALGDGFSTTESFVDDAISGLLPLALFQDRADFNVEFSTSRNTSRTITLVVHTQSSLIFEDADQLRFSMRPAGYAVRTDGGRGGRVQGTLPNTCGSNTEVDDVAVYVYPPDASSNNLLDIQGSGSVNEPVVSFVANESLGFLSPRLPPGDWKFSWTCQALDDDPDAVDTAVRNELRNNAIGPVSLVDGEITTLDF
ncbi:hypothetical protein J2T57_000852 [Natronocella acetinitrilica]|uniref:DUF4382 domain-containing protein n=1 Tax=Natronocella acetinitrilica TaxID=414046 RepID=A0AAE3G3L2_9GAMM|nr:hypothetical protein [Natronocella acetinitrilica]MCP1673753.1 hypothetical protein [Natronocella acetinitrilica]